MQKAKSTIRGVPVLEVIVSSVSDAIEAQRGGAHRLEIIRDFQRGGLTPSLELVQDILNSVTLEVRVMLREGDGYEVESNAEIETLCDIARRLARLNVGGVVLGFLRRREIDVQLTERVLSYVPTLPATFHHAFDEAEDQFAAIRVLKQIKQVDRILTSGGAQEWPQKLSRLSQYQKEAGSEIEILAGGGMDEQSIRTICQATSIREFHVGRAAREPASALGAVRTERVKALVEIIKECP